MEILSIMKTLKELNAGETARIIRIHGTGPLRRRIMDMGITRGIEVIVRNIAPFGDPIEITVRGYQLTIRKEDAALIEVE